MSTSAISPGEPGVAGSNRPKPLDANSYATKKTIAQGMLDIALLTANASQLKYVLQVGEKHEFYSLMVALISVSIILQVVIGIINVTLGSAFNINKQPHQRVANVWNNVVLALNIVTTAVNVVISAFDMRQTGGGPITRLFNMSTTTPSGAIAA